MSSSVPSMRLGWKVEEMSNTSTKGRPNHQTVDSDRGWVLSCWVSRASQLTRSQRDVGLWR